MTMFCKSTFRNSACVLMLALAPVAGADDLHRDAAVGGAIGGALGGVIGAELGGRDGAVIGAGVGAAVGTSINTDGHSGHVRHDGGDHRHHQQQSQPSRFCPPGQAKKGRC